MTAGDLRHEGMALPYFGVQLRQVADGVLGQPGELPGGVRQGAPTTLRKGDGVEQRVGERHGV